MEKRKNVKSINALLTADINHIFTLIINVPTTQTKILKYEKVILYS